ncbi:MAG TPA: sigma-70 family RNA polymerase sigma factor [Candidatus Sulfotelmatobacter sp.]|nr:sigma-70 family RNA polymerase sigma factor [Candidatus Sulfotelmatobacter sp.]
MKEPDPSLPAATFAELALPLLDQLYNFAHWLTKDASEAEDLVQETYAKALRGFSSFQPGTNFRAWMYRILRNSFLNSRTGLKVMVPIESEEQEPLLPKEEQTPESILLRQADRARVQQGLSELAVHLREILLLCDVEEMSYQEISETLGIPMGTVMSRLHRARRALRKILQQSSEEVRNAV